MVPNQDMSQVIGYQNNSYKYVLLLGLLLLHMTWLSKFVNNLESYVAISIYGLTMLVNLPFGMRYLSFKRNKYLSLVLLIFLVGALHGIAKGYMPVDIIRDFSFVVSLVAVYVMARNFIGSTVPNIDSLEKYILLTCLATLPLYFSFIAIGYLNAPNVYIYRTGYVLKFASPLYVFPVIILIFRQHFGLALFSRRLDAFLLLIFVLAVAVSLARTDFIILMIIHFLIIFLMYHFGRITLHKLGIYILSVCALIFFLVGTPEIQKKLDSKEDTSLEWRYVELDTFKSLMAVKEASGWVFGEGLGYRMPLPFVQLLAGREYKDIPVTHNSYQFYVMKTGLVGFCLFVIPFGFKAVRNFFSKDFYLAKSSLIYVTILLKGITLMGLHDTKILTIMGLYLAIDYQYIQLKERRSLTI